MSSKELKEKPYKIVNRTGVPVAVPQFINSATDAFSPDLQNIITPKLWKLGTWNFERRFTSSLLSHLMCHVSHVTCDMSCVTWHMSLEYVFFFTKGCILLMEGPLSTELTPSSFLWLGPLGPVSPVVARPVWMCVVPSPWHFLVWILPAWMSKLSKTVQN